MNKIVLVTSIGTVNAHAVIYELRKIPSVKHVIGADINDKRCIVSSRDVDEFYKFPCVVEAPDDYVLFLKNFCNQHQVTDVFAFIDEEIVALSKYNSVFRDIGVHLCMPEKRVVDICHYKDRFSDWMIDNFPDFAIKRYHYITDVRYPAFLKPAEGRASIGCKKVNCKEDIEFAIGNLPFSQFIVQPFLSGNVIAADVVRDRKGMSCRSIQRKELLRNGNGCGIAVEIVENPEIDNFCSRFAERIDLNGVVNVEFLITDDGIRVIEVNPRLAAGTSYSCMAGFPIVEYALSIANGECCGMDNLSVTWSGKRFARRYETYEM